MADIEKHSPAADSIHQTLDVDSLPVLYWVADRQGTLAALGGRYFRQFGMDAKSRVGQPLRQVFAEASEAILTAHEECFQRGRSWLSFEFRGQAMFAHLACDHQRSEASQGGERPPAQWVRGVAFPCDMRIVESHYDLFHESLRMLPLPVALTDVETNRLVLVNQAFLSIGGYELDDVIGKTSLEMGMWPKPEDREKLSSVLDRTGKIEGIETEVLTKRGERLLIRVYGHLVLLDQRPTLLSVAEDITETRRNESALRAAREELEIRVAERTAELTNANQRLKKSIEHSRRVTDELRRSEAKWRSVTETAVDILLFLDSDGKILDLNRKSKGRRGEQLVGRSIYELIPKSQHSRVREAIGKVIETGQTEATELVGLGRRGETRWFNARFGPVFVDDQVVGATLFANDISKRVEAEKRLESEETLLRGLLQLQERERQLIAYDLHDGFLQDIVGAHMQLQSLEFDDDRVTQKLDYVRDLLIKAINEARRMISELRPMVLDQMGIHEALQFIIDEEEAKGLTIHYTNRLTSKSFAPLIESTLLRVLKETITNSRRHGGVDELTVRLTQAGELLVLEVIDEGAGFDPQQVPVGRYGLEGIRERARMFGGGATIESSPGQGTRVSVVLPLEDSPGENDERIRWSYSI